MEKSIMMESTVNCGSHFSNLAILSRPDGSATFSKGKTTVLAGVYGPIEAKSQVTSEKTLVKAYFRPKSGMPGVGDRLYETIIKNICETSFVQALYPRSAVIANIQEMQDGGELISCAVNALCLALLDSGIDMKFLVAAVTCCMDKNDVLKENPTFLEQKNAKATFVFVFESAKIQNVASYTKGCFTEQQYQHSYNLCKQNSLAVFEYYKCLLNKKYTV